MVEYCNDTPSPVSTSPVVIPEGSKDAINLLTLFKFSPIQTMCQGYEFILSLTNQPTPAAIAPLAIDKDLLTITKAITFKTEFYVVMRSPKSMKFGAVKFITTYTPKPAEFKPPLDDKVSVEVTISDKGGLTETPEFLYTSPTGSHPDGFTVKLSVAWEGA